MPHAVHRVLIRVRCHLCSGSIYVALQRKRLQHGLHSAFFFKLPFVFFAASPLCFFNIHIDYNDFFKWSAKNTAQDNILISLSLHSIHKTHLAILSSWINLPVWKDVLKNYCPYPKDILPHAFFSIPTKLSIFRNQLYNTQKRIMSSTHRPTDDPKCLITAHFSHII